jgi:hypothetical protein
LIAEEHSQKRETYPIIRRCMMYKNSALLSIGAALLCSLFVVDVGHAFQIEKRQGARVQMAGEMKGTANPATTQVSTTPNPCTEGGKGKTGAPSKKRCPIESGEQVADGARYTSTTMLR